MQVMRSSFETTHMMLRCWHSFDYRSPHMVMASTAAASCSSTVVCRGLDGKDGMARSVHMNIGRSDTIVSFRGRQKQSDLPFQITVSVWTTAHPVWLFVGFVRISAPAASFSSSGATFLGYDDVRFAVAVAAVVGCQTAQGQQPILRSVGVFSHTGQNRRSMHAHRQMAWLMVLMAVSAAAFKMAILERRQDGVGIE
jgi:hypothetical protein